MNIDVGILGFGTVGAGVYKILKENRKDILHREGLNFNVKKVLVKDFEHEPNLNLAPIETFTTRVDEMAEDTTIKIVVECMGGVEPARTFILKMLASGKTVVTSNKEVIAKHWPELEQAAKDNGCELYIEATVGGGIPIIRALTDSLQANNITQVMGIINGTTNYILTNMTEKGSDFAQTLAEAQKLGYAEANPINDVDGFDVAYKLSILSSIAFHAHIPLELIYREGISKVTPEDIGVARDLGYIIKLLAIGKRSGSKIEVRVHPTLIPKSHPLAAVNGVFNAIFIHGHAVDDVMLYGRGAGQMPTASAVVSDVINAAHASHMRYMTFRNTYEMSDEIEIEHNWLCKYLIRITAKDQPGVLAKVCNIFGKNAVSLNSIIQKKSDGQSASVVFVTHNAHETAVTDALEGISALDEILSVDNMLRVEESV